MRFKRVILAIALLLLALYIPLSITIYSKSWYEYNYDLDKVYDKNAYADSVTDELLDYFLYKGELSHENWSDKDIRHMRDVRNLYFWFFVIVIGSIFLLARYGIDMRTSLYSIGLLILLGILSLSNFDWFWNTFLHPLLFNNSDWIVGPGDTCFVLFFPYFFLRSAIFVVTFAFIQLLLLFLYLYSKEKTLNRFQ